MTRQVIVFFPMWWISLFGVMSVWPPLNQNLNRNQCLRVYAHTCVQVWLLLNVCERDSVSVCVITSVWDFCLPCHICTVGMSSYILCGVRDVLLFMSKTTQDCLQHGCLNWGMLRCLRFRTALCASTVWPKGDQGQGPRRWQGGVSLVPYSHQAKVHSWME